MAFLKPLWMQPFSSDPAIEYLPDQDRLGLLGSVFSREGVVDYLANHLKVSQRAAGANLSVDVAVGRCVIAGDDVPDQGSYLCQSTTVANIALTKPASGTRTYRIVARVRDKSSSASWSGHDWTVEGIFDGSSSPVLPPSAISLALVAVSSSASSIVDANITDTRSRATVGTNAVTGSWGVTGFSVNWASDDSTRPLTWGKNADGWVMLSGWVRRVNVQKSVSANAFNYFDESVGEWNTSSVPVLDPEIRPAGIRDFIGISSNGDVHFIVYPGGQLSYRFLYATTLAIGANQSWISFDNCKYRANAF